MQYNLVRNGYFDSLTTSGTGNTELTWAQLESLMDGVTTSGGITLTSSGVLFLEVDLSQRIKIDEIRLYANDLNQAAYINFYYKNAVGDSYTLLTTQSGSYYYATISDPSAPRYVRATISGVAITLYEFEVLNDDYIVAFGEDGTQYAEYLGDTPIGEEGDPQAVAIFNNGVSAMPADAYVCIDYTGEVADEYVKISASENGTYYGIYDGILIDDNQAASEYRWDMGIHNQISVLADKIINQPTNSVALKVLPLLSASEGFNAGANCWDYDDVNRLMYVMGRDGSILKLWSYDQPSDSWTYLSQVNASGTNDDNAAVMTYCNGAIYAMCKVDGTQFGKYTVSGTIDNWTALTNPSWSVTPIPGTPNFDRVGLCSDGTRYVYALVSRGNTYSNKEFKRYDTISGTWSTLNNGWGIYYMSTQADRNNTLCLTFDKDRGCMYAFIYPTEMSQGGGGGGSNWVQRYRVNDDAWDIAYIYVGGSIDNNYMRAGISYNYNKIYFSINKDSTYQYYMGIYDFSTSQISRVYLGYRQIDPSQGDVGLPILATGFGVFIGQIDGYRSYMVKYLTPDFLYKVGVYKSPIFELEEANNSSYFLINGTTTSGLGSISYDAGSYNGTTRVRSSNTRPMTANEVYSTKSGPSGYVYLDQWKPYPNEVTNNYLYVQDDAYNGGLCFVDRRTGYYAVAYLHYSAPYNYNRVEVMSKAGTQQWRLDGGGNSYLYWYYFCDFDHVGGIWGYNQTNSTGYRLHHINYLGSIIATIYDGTDFLYDLAVEWDGDGVWYTDKINNLVRHRNNVGTSLQSIVLPQPRSICSTTDNGCWVIDNTNLNAYRYTSSGILSQTISLGRQASRMTYDYYDGFWYVYDNHVYHVTSDGITDVNVLFTGVGRVIATRDGCIAHNSSTGSVRFIDYSTGTVTRTWAASTSNYMPGVLSVDIDSVSETTSLDSYDLIPAVYDPVWGTVSGSLAWQEVRKDGYFLPKAKYHQVEVTLRGNATLEEILMAPAIKVQDIASQTYKDVYVKTDIPIDADITDYEARIKTWWGVE
jgi:hypothetical protein